MALSNTLGGLWITHRRPCDAGDGAALASNRQATLDTCRLDRRTPGRAGGGGHPATKPWSAFQQTRASTPAAQVTTPGVWRECRAVYQTVIRRAFVQAKPRTPGPDQKPPKAKGLVRKAGEATRTPNIQLGRLTPPPQCWGVGELMGVGFWLRPTADHSSRLAGSSRPLASDRNPVLVAGGYSARSWSQWMMPSATTGER